jgi:DNA repair exonuclease SbcCD ATPase subunit
MVAANRKTSGHFLSTLRDVLFEATPQAAAKVSDHALEPPTDSASLDAARAALRESLREHLGPGLSELLLQLQALDESLPEPAPRLRAALRVLSLKGVAHDALSRELTQANARLSAQGQAFASKLTTRREALAQRCAQLEDDAQARSAAARARIAELQAELDEIAASHDTALHAAEQERAELDVKQRCFERAFEELHEQYRALGEQLANRESF